MTTNPEADRPNPADKPTSPNLPVKRRSLWRNQDYVSWLAADTSDQLGSAMRTFSFTMVAFAVTNDSSQAGLVTTVGAVILVLCQIPGGVIVDRFDRKKIMLVSTSTRALIMFGAVIAWLLGFVNIWMLLITSILTSINAGLFWSATNSALKQIVDPEDFAKANSANQSRDAVINMASGPLSGFLMNFYLFLPFLANGILSLIGAGLVTRIKRDLRPVFVDGKRESKSFWHEFVDGLRFIKTNNALFIMVIAVALLNFAGQTMVSAVLLGLQKDSVPFWAIGVITAIPSIGMIAMAAYTGKKSDNWRIGWAAITALSVATLAATPLIFTMHPVVVMVCASILFASLVPATILLQSYTMTVVPSRLQARTNTVIATGAMGLSAFSPAIAGFLIKYFNSGVAILAGVLIMATATSLMLFSKSIRELGTRPQLEYAE